MEVGARQAREGEKKIVRTIESEIGKKILRERASASAAAAAAATLARFGLFMVSGGDMYIYS